VFLPALLFFDNKRDTISHRKFPKMDETPGKMYALASVMTVLAIAAVPLRFYARHVKTQRLLLDDWLILPALLFTIGTAVCMYVGTALGDLGRHTKVGPEGPIFTERTTVFLKASFASLLTQTLTFGFTKLSVLMFYKRIFQGPTFNRVIWTVIVIIILWTIAFFLVNLLECLPIPLNWVGNGDLAGHCINETSMYIGQAYSDVFTDILILSLPLPMIWKLHMATRRKVAISGIFLLGTLVVIAGIIKVVVFNHVAKEFDGNNPDLTYILTPTFYWPMIESSLGVLGACLPTLRPIFQGWSPESVINSVRSMISLESYRSSRTRNQSTGYIRSTDGDDTASTAAITNITGKNKYEVTAEGTKLKEFGSTLTEFEVPEDGIMVQRDYKTDRMA